MKILRYKIKLISFLIFAILIFSHLYVYTVVAEWNPDDEDRIFFDELIDDSRFDINDESCIYNSSNNGFVHLRDIHFKKRYLNVQINFPSPIESLDQKIIDASIKPTAYGWRLINLEYIYPLTAKAYLH